MLPVQGGKWDYLERIRWAADGRSLFAITRTSSSWVLLSVYANGNPTVLHETPLGSAWISSVVPSPDGKHLAFIQRVFVQDVMLLENF